MAIQVRQKLPKSHTPGVLEFLEEVTQLLRTLPISAWLSYYVGTLPFCAAFLFYWADMSRSAFAYRRCADGALLLALLFIWMKCWQTVFAGRIRSFVSGNTSVWNWQRIARMISVQAGCQASGLFILPLALLIMLPFGWCYAFYQNFTVYGDGRQASEAQPSAWRQAKANALRWPGQNHLALSILALFAIVVFSNICFSIIWLPNLMKTLFGFETPFSRGVLHMLNSTFFAVAGTLTYLCVDPIIKAFYTLRCFYGDSLFDGEDLRVELQLLSHKPSLAYKTIVLLLLSSLLLMPTATSDDSAGQCIIAPVTATAHAVGDLSPTALDRSIDEVLSEPQYSWRMPRERERTAATEKGILYIFVQSIVETVGAWLRTIGNYGSRFLQWLRHIWPQREPPIVREEHAGVDWMFWVQMLMLLVLLFSSCLLILFAWRLWQRRKPAGRTEVETTRVDQIPDIAAEDIDAAVLSPDAWLDLAHELLAGGDRRLALRALYMSALAHLADQRLLVVAKCKSNLEYQSELARRAHVLPNMVEAFRQNVTIFDRTWYGRHDVTDATLQTFENNYRVIVNNA